VCAGQKGEDSQKRTTTILQAEFSGQVEEDRQNRTGRTGQEKLERQNKTGRTRQAEQDCQNRTARKKIPDSATRTGLPAQNS
jgi:hypothetical protein